MTHPVAIQFRETDPAALAAREGAIALLVDPGAGLGAAGRRLDKGPVFHHHSARAGSCRS